MKKMFIMLLLIILAITGCSSTKTDEIVIYSSAEEERNAELKKQLSEKFPDLNIVVQYMSTGNNAAKIKAEGINVEADIILGLETSQMEGLIDNFADLSYYDDSYYVDNLNPEHNKYLIYEKYTASLIIDKSYFEKNGWDFPKSYNDLLDSKYKNLIAMPDPKTSGTGYMYYLNVVNIKGEDDALKYFDELSKNIKKFTTSGSGPINLLKQGEIAIAMGMTYQGASEITNGANFEIIELDTKTPYNTTSSAIIKGREEIQKVREVFEFIMKDFLKYDKEHFVPGKILKEQDSKIPNFPNNLSDADMTGIDNLNLKNDLISKWKY
jgi:iron(III) transport system substrate-binding protein